MEEIPDDMELLEAALTEAMALVMSQVDNYEGLYEGEGDQPEEEEDFIFDEDDIEYGEDDIYEEEDIYEEAQMFGPDIIELLYFEEIPSEDDMFGDLPLDHILVVINQIYQ